MLENSRGGRWQTSIFAEFLFPHSRLSYTVALVVCETLHGLYKLYFFLRLLSVFIFVTCNLKTLSDAYLLQFLPFCLGSRQCDIVPRH